MIEKIKKALAESNIERWRINEVKEESAELFFVKHNLDTRRIKDTHKCVVTVSRELEKDGKKLVGETGANINPSMSYAEIKKEIEDAYFAAQFAMNPYYAPPKKVVSDTVEKHNELATAPLAQSAGKMAEAIFSADTNKHAYINSTEVFCHRLYCHILSSEGTDVSFTDATCKGDYVVQCKTPDDVELINQFEYDDVNTDALKQGVKEYLDFVYDRACAKKTLKSGKYDVVLSGKNLAEILSYYTEKSAADMIYPGYSSWKEGEAVQGEVKGDALDLTLIATRPFSGDGIKMQDLEVIENGKLRTIHGSTPFCRYLGIEPTGVYDKTKCNNEGSVSFEDMKKTPCLWTVAFSDFQMDTFTGHFGGEIRLAYLIENGKVTPVTGGSINGNLIEAQRNMLFSKDRFVSANYEGPYAVKFFDIPVAGTAN